ncbi:MAG: hypothetical protein AAF937_00545 [Planctomycetota bacterium]
MITATQQGELWGDPTYVVHLKWRWIGITIHGVRDVYAAIVEAYETLGEQRLIGCDFEQDEFARNRRTPLPTAQSERLPRGADGLLEELEVVEPLLWEEAA